MFNDSLPCGEGLGVGGLPSFDVWECSPPCPSTTRVVVTLWPAPRSNFAVQFLCSLAFGSASGMTGGGSTARGPCGSDPDCRNVGGIGAILEHGGARDQHVGA